MAIPNTALSHFRVLLQIDQNLVSLQRKMRQNAQAWKAGAEGQTVPVNQLAQFMNNAATTYQGNLAWLGDFQTNNPVDFPKIVTMWNKLGGTNQEFQDTITPMQTVANNLAAQPKTTYAEIITACDFIIGEINAPLSLWPE